jgi:hypothetical protein
MPGNFLIAVPPEARRPENGCALAVGAVFGLARTPNLRRREADFPLQSFALDTVQLKVYRYNRKYFVFNSYFKRERFG